MKNEQAQLKRECGWDNLEGIWATQFISSIVSVWTFGMNNTKTQREVCKREKKTK